MFFGDRQILKVFAWFTGKDFYFLFKKMGDYRFFEEKNPLEERR